MTPVQIAGSLARDRSKRNITRIRKRMVRDGVDFRGYLAEVRRHERPVNWYMTWLLSHYVEASPEDGARGQRPIWGLLKDCEDPSMRRDLWRALSFIEVNDQIAGDVFDAAVRVIASTKQPIAVRAHAIFTARNVALPYAELRRELGLVLEGLSVHERPAVRTRSRNVLRELWKMETVPRR